ncbi:hypothetical protein BDV93DRAFT_511197 [Ceratobasidium sp. AG-I]|nr:hypothetical protein BDV93DRAFT_511197 [Ceratobasidium sp. AG-I]
MLRLPSPIQPWDLKVRRARHGLKRTGGMGGKLVEGDAGYTLEGLVRGYVYVGWITRGGIEWRRGHREEVEHRRLYLGGMLTQSRESEDWKSGKRGGEDQLERILTGDDRRTRCRTSSAKGQLTGNGIIWGTARDNFRLLFNQGVEPRSHSVSGSLGAGGKEQGNQRSVSSLSQTRFQEFIYKDHARTESEDFERDEQRSVEYGEVTWLDYERCPENAKEWGQKQRREDGEPARYTDGARGRETEMVKTWVLRALKLRTGWLYGMARFFREVKHCLVLRGECCWQMLRRVLRGFCLFLVLRENKRIYPKFTTYISNLLVVNSETRIKESGDDFEPNLCKETDIYALGMELLTGKLQFNKIKKDTAVIIALGQGKRPKCLNRILGW